MKDLELTYQFSDRHIGPKASDIKRMLEVVKASSIGALIYETIPEQIRVVDLPDTSKAISEQELIELITGLGKQNKVYRSYIGQGYYNTFVPTVIQRNIFENPGWYTQYTPYQAEISQGRLEALLNFQTMVCDLTGLEVANSSLLDEGTAAAEAMSLAFRQKNKRNKGELRNKYFVSHRCFESTKRVLSSRAEPLGIKLIFGNPGEADLDASFFGVMLQYPDSYGNVEDYSEVISTAHSCDLLVIMAADILGLALLKPPGELGADIAIGSTQRFGVPLGFGGPHAAYFATKKSFVRDIPGRIIGVSIDKHGNPAYRMSLQTREQHIKRAKATSNICTAQALLAIMSGMYCVFHGPKGIEGIAKRIHEKTRLLASHLSSHGYRIESDHYFDTLHISLESNTALSIHEIKEKSLRNGVNFTYGQNSILISLDETTRNIDLEDILRIFDVDFSQLNQQRKKPFAIPDHLIRKSKYLTHKVFQSYHSETQMLRYLKILENMDLSLTQSMIPLGSCTMKLNATTEMIPLSWPEFSQIHPFVPLDQVAGYLKIIEELENDLAKITGFFATSLQPNSGAQGEYAGLMIIRQYHLDRQDLLRKIVLIPASAHGTNPASAVMCGMEVVIVQCKANGNIDPNDLKEKAEKYQDQLAALMITYPSTHGVFEEEICQICDLIHQNGGLVYMDGANMNAQIGKTNPQKIGADVCHLNLHKTFAIPHGGGGPGMGPICVAKHLAPYLPNHPFAKTGGENGIQALSSAPWGSASILLISYAYIKMLGKEGLKKVTEMAILNANYIKDRLSDHYPVLYVGKNGRVAHELILDMRDFKSSTGIEVTDIAKRLMDYGFHAPTVSFPVVGTLMIEPTESEALEELDRFCEAMIHIRNEISQIESGNYSKDDNPLINAPHTAKFVTETVWEHTYTRQTAVYPVSGMEKNKFWPVVGRINESYGDRNLICACSVI